MSWKYNMNNIEEEYIKEEVESRLFAEENGLYDNNNFKMSWEQEMSLHQAMSTLSTLAKETNSSVSDLLKCNGYTII